MNTSGNATEDISFATQMQTMRKVFIYLAMPMVASSIFGNVLIILVVARDKVTTTSILFRILAGEDLLATCVTPLMNILSFFSSTVTNYIESVVILQYNSFVYDTAKAMSTWTLVVITTERFLSITMPFNVKQMMTVKRVILAEFATSFAVVVVNYLRNFIANTFETIQNRVYRVSTSHTWLLFDYISALSFSVPSLIFKS